MKRSVKMIAILIALCLFAGMCVACKPEPVELQIQKSIDNLAKAKSYEMSMDMTMSMETNGLFIDVDTTAETVRFADPVKAKVLTTADVMGTVMSIEQYIVRKDNAVIMYMSDGMDGWIKEEFPAATKALGQYDAELSLDLFLKSTGTFEKIGTEEIDGVMTDVLAGAAPIWAMQDYMDSLLRMLDMHTMTEDPAYYDAVFDTFGGMEDMPLKLWIDPETYTPVQYHMDMTKTMNAVMEALMKTLAAASGAQGNDMSGFTYTVANFEMTVKLRNLNKAAEFTVPATVLGL